MSLDYKPWIKFYNGRPAETEVPELSLYGILSERAKTNPEFFAVEYMGAKLTFKELTGLIDNAADALCALGVEEGDCVTLALPNIPNAVILFYAVNKIGARVAMVHPLSPSVDLEYYLNKTGSKWAVTVDMFVPKFMDIIGKTAVEKLVVCGIADYLPKLKAIAYSLTNKAKLPANAGLLVKWKDFLKTGAAASEKQEESGRGCHEASVILFSGGTSDLPKGIVLSDFSFNALAVNTQKTSDFEAGDSIVAILPVFHGFGLGLCIHMAMVCGGMSILIPKFSTENYIGALMKHKPQFIAGVPTLFEALLRDPGFKSVRFDKLKGAYSGGDSLPHEAKMKFDAALRAQGSKVDLLEGYGTTECVTACVLTPPGNYRKGSIGVPMVNMETCIVREDTTEVLPPNEEGEICIAGPQLMVSYLDDCEATARTLRIHSDGKLWLHSGDQGYMDADGYLYFKSRIKRIFKVSGVNVYPPQVEYVLESHPAVSKACVIGVHDDYQGKSVKAFIVLADNAGGDSELADELRAYCAERLIKWSVPKTIVFRKELPTTLVGKVAYTALEKAASN
ncbi:MAG: AMP-binding protein [Clostridiales bacterium]|nr:AMP-binding protein [Clostridiales bacterium]